MSFSVRDKTILITGASSGIGEHVAYDLSTKGAKLVLCARRVDRLLAVQERCIELGATQVDVIRVDLGSPDSMDNLVNQLAIKAIDVDVLINNAGFGHSEPFISTDFQLVMKLFQVNVLGLMYLTQQLALNMLDQGGGQIINVASLAGKVSTPNYATYGATKGAVISFSNALRMELKPHNIQVTTVNLGPVDTPFFENIEKNRREASAEGPLALSVSKAAKVVSNTIGKNKREVNRPLLLAVGAKMYVFVPAVGDYILMNFFRD